MSSVPLPEAIKALRKRYGPPPPSKLTDPLHLILHENVAYFVSDEVREQVWAAFKKVIGLDPAKILKAGELKIAAAIEKGGMQPLQRSRKLIECARIAHEECDDDLASILNGPIKDARRILKKFPGIGEPGADKILLFTRTASIPALESNGVRVVLRLGHGDEDDAYAKQYRAATDAMRAQLPQKAEVLIEAHHLLRIHGKETCIRTGPRCGECPLAKLGCPVGRDRLGLCNA